MPNPSSQHEKDKLTLAPRSFEEALTVLLEVAPPDKDDAPEPEPEAPPQKQPRKRKTKRDDEQGSR